MEAISARIMISLLVGGAHNSQLWWDFSVDDEERKYCGLSPIPG
jgi:hypothetical protein